MKKPPRKPKRPTPAHALDARRRVTVYMLSVIEDPAADVRRRDEMALCLAKIEASWRNPATPSGRPAKLRASNYVSKKKEAEAASKTAQKGSAWDGLINGSQPRARKHIEFDE